MTYVFDEFVGKKALPQVRFIGLSTCLVGKVSALQGEFLNLFHSVFNYSLIVFVVEGVEVNGGVSYYSQLSCSLGLEVIAPLKSSYS